MRLQVRKSTALLPESVVSLITDFRSWSFVPGRDDLIKGAKLQAAFLSFLLHANIIKFFRSTRIIHQIFTDLNGKPGPT
jgi:hypothetical protein